MCVSYIPQFELGQGEFCACSHFPAGPCVLSPAYWVDAICFLFCFVVGQRYSLNYRDPVVCVSQMRFSVPVNGLTVTQLFVLIR